MANQLYTKDISGNRVSFNPVIDKELPTVYAESANKYLYYNGAELVWRVVDNSILTIDSTISGTSNPVQNRAIYDRFAKTDEAISQKADKSTSVTHNAGADVGTPYRPVYINNNGQATPTLYDIKKSVPENAVFTDTYIDSSFFSNTDTDLRLTLVTKGTEEKRVVSVVPNATKTTRGVIKVGNNLRITDGVLSADDPYVLPRATTESLGGVKIGSNLNYSEGVLNGLPPYKLQPATNAVLGGIKIGENLKITADGTLSAVAAPYTLPIANAETLGGVKIGQRLTIDTNGILSADDQTRKATDTELGSVIVGDNITVDENGRISTHSKYVHPEFTERAPSNYTIGCDSEGHVVFGDEITSVKYADKSGESEVSDKAKVAESLASELTVGISQGGTGATTQQGALINLGAATRVHNHSGDDISRWLIGYKVPNALSADTATKADSARPAPVFQTVNANSLTVDETSPDIITVSGSEISLTVNGTPGTYWVKEIFSPKNTISENFINDVISYKVGGVIEQDSWVRYELGSTTGKVKYIKLIWNGTSGLALLHYYTVRSNI